MAAVAVAEREERAEPVLLGLADADEDAARRRHPRSARVVEPSEPDAGVLVGAAEGARSAVPAAVSEPRDVSSRRGRLEHQSLGDGAGAAEEAGLLGGRDAGVGVREHRDAAAAAGGRRGSERGVQDLRGQERDVGGSRRELATVELREQLELPRRLGPTSLGAVPQSEESLGRAGPRGLEGGGHHLVQRHEAPPPPRGPVVRREGAVAARVAAEARDGEEGLGGERGEPAPGEEEARVFVASAIVPALPCGGEELLHLRGESSSFSIVVVILVFVIVIIADSADLEEAAHLLERDAARRRVGEEEVDGVAGAAREFR